MLGKAHGFSGSHVLSQGDWSTSKLATGDSKSRGFARPWEPRGPSSGSSNCEPKISWMSVYDGYGMLSYIPVRPTSADWAIRECYLESYPTLNHHELSRAYHHPLVISVSSGQSAEKLTRVASHLPCSVWMSSLPCCGRISMCPSLLQNASFSMLLSAA
jgi:hypothetical protein